VRKRKGKKVGDLKGVSGLTGPTSDRQRKKPDDTRSRKIMIYIRGVLRKKEKEGNLCRYALEISFRDEVKTLARFFFKPLFLLYHFIDFDIGTSGEILS